MSVAVLVAVVVVVVALSFVVLSIGNFLDYLCDRWRTAKVALLVVDLI